MPFYPKETMLQPFLASVPMISVPKRVSPLFTRGETLVGQIGGECITFVKEFLNVESKKFYGYAGAIRPNSIDPFIGRAILLKYKMGHAGVVVDIEEDLLTVLESNFELDGKITMRKISATDSRIRGYFEFE